MVEIKHASKREIKGNQNKPQICGPNRIIIILWLYPFLERQRLFSRYFLLTGQHEKTHTHTDTKAWNPITRLYFSFMWETNTHIYHISDSYKVINTHTHQDFYSKNCRPNHTKNVLISQAMWTMRIKIRRISKVFLALNRASMLHTLRKKSTATTTTAAAIAWR